MNSFVLAVSTMVGTIVGAGIFGVPYVIAKGGAGLAIFYFLLVGSTVLLLHLLFGEIVLRTQGKHRMVGYAKIYLGAWGKTLTALSMIIALGGTLLAYLILGGHFLEIVFSRYLPFSDTQFSLLFLALSSLFIAQGRKLITKAEVFLNAGLLLAVGAVVFFAFPHLTESNFHAVNPKHLFLPYGVLLFTLVGLEAIPEIASFLRDAQSKVKLHKVIIAATLIATLLTFLFAFAVAGVSGPATTDDAFSGLIPVLGNNIALIGAFLGLLTISSSFLIIGNYLKNSLRHDFGVSTGPAIGITLALPLLPFLLGVREFIPVIGAIGAILGAFEGLLMIRIFQQAKMRGDRVPEYSISVPAPILFFTAILLVGGAAATVFF